MQPGPWSHDLDDFGAYTPKPRESPISWLNSQSSDIFDEADSSDLLIFSFDTSIGTLFYSYETVPF